MSSGPASKHANRSAITRSRFIETAQQLFAERSIDSVSLNEITVAAGQKNRNALQYHFSNREGLLQAIIDTHAERVKALRQQYLASNMSGRRNAASAAARALVQPLTEYIDENPAGIYYVKILSQLAALNNTVLNPASRSSINFQQDEGLATLLRSALAHLTPAEAQRRMFLTISMTFHSLADICRAAEGSDTSPRLKQRTALFDQVTLAVEALLASPPLES